MDIQTILDALNSIIEKKRTIDKINHELTLMSSSIPKQYGLYLIPDDPIAFGHCNTIFKGINWGGAHITIAGFSENNGKLIPNILQQINNSSLKTKKWNPNIKTVTIQPKKYIIKSTSLDNLGKFLLTNGLEKIHNDWHIYCENGVVQNPKFAGTTWSLIMIEKDGINITWKHDTKIQFHDMHPPSSDTLKILTYNIWYLAMISKHYECAGEKCANNIALIINNTSTDYDFIGLQEASYTHLLDKKCPVLKTMNSYKTKAGVEDSVTYYNKKYTLMFSGTNTIVKPNRPMQILIFSEGIIFINVHLGHYHGILNAMLIDINFCIKSIIQSIPNIHNIFATYRIIMVGDFNDDIKALKNPFPITFGGIVRNLHINTTNLNTCCNTGNLTDPRFGQHADNILDSKASPVTIKIPNEFQPASDHAPVFAELIP